MKVVPSCSLIVSTYNWPEALEATLLSVFKQSVVPNEIVICDDGSGEPTRRVIEKLTAMSPVPLVHVWHPDEGFRKAMSMNKGVAATTGDYIIVIDHDVILHKDFVKDHLRCCKRGRFLTGNRFYIDPVKTKEIIETKNVTKPFAFNLSKNGVRMLRVSVLQKLMASFYHWEKEYQFVLGCNISFWRDDFLRANGYDESFEGWGWEDTDLALRFINSGVKLTFIRFAAIQFHLYHKEASRAQEKSNYHRAMETMKEKKVCIEKGVHQYIQKDVHQLEPAPTEWQINPSKELISA